jgi:hypothetical protein
MSDDKRLARIEMKLDDTNDHLSAIDGTLREQHVSLKEHMRRTALIEQELQPIKKHVNMVQGVIAFLTILATIAAIITAFRK